MRPAPGVVEPQTERPFRVERATETLAMSKPRLKPCVLALERLEDRCTPAAPGVAWPHGAHPDVPAVSDAPAGEATDSDPAPVVASSLFGAGARPAAHGLYTALLNESAGGPAATDFGIKIDAETAPDSPAASNTYRFAVAPSATPARGFAARVFTSGPNAVAALIQLYDPGRSPHAPPGPDHDFLASGPHYTGGPGPHPDGHDAWSGTTDASNKSSWDRPYYL
jgi:hypothetical protein